MRGGNALWLIAFALLGALLGHDVTVFSGAAKSFIDVTLDVILLLATATQIEGPR